MPDFGATEALIAAQVVGGMMGSDAAKSAGDTQAAAADRSSALQKSMFDSTSRNMAPWMRSGNVALNQLMYLTGLGNKPGSAPKADPKTGTLTSDNKVFRSDSNDYLGRFGYGDPGGGSLEEIAPTWGMDRVVDQSGNVVWGKAFDEQPQVNDEFKGSLLKPFGMSDFQESPAYQFNLAQGQKAIDKGANARGKYYAPSTLQDIAKFSQGLASNEFQNSYNNYNTNLRNVWDRLYSMSGSGQNAAAQQGAFGASAAQNIGNNITSAGAAQAAGGVGAANAISGGVNGAYNGYMTNQILQSLQSPAYKPPGGNNFLADAEASWMRSG